MVQGYISGDKHANRGGAVNNRNRQYGEVYNDGVRIIDRGETSVSF
jgi:hypothetical protein